MDDANLHGLGNFRARKIPAIQFLEDDHARIVANLPRELVVPDIDRVNFRCSTLQQTICETSGGSSDIEGDLISRFDMEKIERAFELYSTATYILRAGLHMNLGIGGM